MSAGTLAAAREAVDAAIRAALLAADDEVARRVRDTFPDSRIASVSFVGLEAEPLWFVPEDVTLTYVNGEVFTEDESEDAETVREIVEDVYRSDDWYDMVAHGADADRREDQRRPHVVRVMDAVACNECGSLMSAGEVAAWWPHQAMEDGEPHALPVCAACVEANR